MEADMFPMGLASPDDDVGILTIEYLLDSLADWVSNQPNQLISSEIDF